MKVRYIFLFSFALFVDFIQWVLGLAAFAVGLGLTAITPLGGAGAGATAAAAAGCVKGVKLVNDLVCIGGGAAAGAAASAFGGPMGILLGFVCDVVVTLTLGSALVFALWLMDMYYPTRIWTNYLVELIPGLNVIPAWSLMVILCILRDRSKNSAIGNNMLQIGQAGAMIASGNPIAMARGAKVISREVQSSRIAYRDVQKQGTQVLSNRYNGVVQPAPNAKQVGNDEVKQRVPLAQNDNAPYIQKTA